jgi:dipeptidyl aminopeptidase/acylaminoacyl peptidase
MESRNADPERLMISGGSAGGYTTLCALTLEDDKVFLAPARAIMASATSRLSRATPTNSSPVTWTG